MVKTSPYRKLQMEFIKTLGEEAWTPLQISCAVNSLGHDISFARVMRYVQKENLYVTTEQLGITNPMSKEMLPAKYWIPRSKVQNILNHFGVPLETTDIDAELYGCFTNRDFRNKA